MCTYGVFELLLFRMGLELFPTTSISSSSDSEDVVREGSLFRFLPPFEAGLPVVRASMTKVIFKSNLQLCNARCMLGVSIETLWSPDHNVLDNPYFRKKRIFYVLAEFWAGVGYVN